MWQHLTENFEWWFYDLLWGLIFIGIALAGLGIYWLFKTLQKRFFNE